MPREGPFAGTVADMPPDDFALLSSAVAERRCREEVGFGTFAEAAAYRPHPPRPSYGSAATWRDGLEEGGTQRYRRGARGRRCNSLAGTALEHSKSDMPTWVGFARLMRSNAPRRHRQGLRRDPPDRPGWRHRLFATVDGCQDRLVLRGRVWLDETYVTDTDLAHGYGEAGKRGLSKWRLCIAVAIDVRKNPVARVCGHGKPSSKGIGDGLAGDIAEGPTMVGDRECAHNALVRAARGTHEAYRADA